MNTERYTAEQYRNGEHIRRPKGKKKGSGPYRNALELRFANEQKKRLLVGEIAGYSFETEKLQITFGNFPEYYIPDHRVDNLDGSIDMFETKFVNSIVGRKAIMRAREGLLKLKIARDKYPDRNWYLVEWLDGRWIKTEQ